MRDKRVIYTIVAALVFVAAAICGYVYYERVAHDPVPSGAQAAVGAGGYDLTDRRQVVGISSNVFLGRVDARVGETGLPVSGPGDESIPMSQYSVTVERSIKGDLPASVIVNTITYTDNPVLKEGAVYLFAAVPNRTYDLDGDPIGHSWLSVSYPGVDHIEVVGLDQQASLVASFTAALQNQVKPDPFE